VSHVPDLRFILEGSRETKLAMKIAAESAELADDLERAKLRAGEITDKLQRHEPLDENDLVFIEIADQLRKDLERGMGE